MAGVVSASERPGRVKGRGQLSLRFTSITVGDERLAVRSNAITFHGKDERKKDAVKIGGGAGIGAVVGGIIGGGGGAAKGAAIGGAAGTGAVLATRGQRRRGGVGHDAVDGNHRGPAGHGSALVVIEIDDRRRCYPIFCIAPRKSTLVLVFPSLSSSSSMASTADSGLSTLRSTHTRLRSSAR
jgi:hypothetical protein